ncbi:glycosyltransferase [Butyrivibrio sp. VCD2006]|uniref:glycosyltransferase n=1 Tax=Butyrivibrio sp. VCD2006 TaxID=1280664 RepID=UPI00041C0321|nr:glycosyltransferase [Butyrivibrio sp. VCD2006]
MKYFISVAMATYNGEEYIKEQLDSIFNQTYPVDEVIIRDDISSDNTAAVIESYIKDNGLGDKVDFKVNEKNFGYASNFVGALRKTRGEIVFFSDQDDIWPETRVERMIEAFERRPDALMIGSEFEPFKCSDDAPDVPRWELAKFKNDGSMEKLEFTSENIFIGCQGCTMAMRRSFLNKIDEYWYEGWAHDEFVWKLALAMEGLYFLHEVTLKRRLHANNVTLHKEHEKDKRLKYLRDLKKSHERTLKFVNDSEGESSSKAALLKKHITATEKRIELIQNRRLFNSLILLKYGDCYHKRRSIPVEFLMAFK